MTREQTALLAKVNSARTELANKYGNLCGMKLRDWFVFNGEAAVFKGGDLSSRKAIELRFDERLAILRGARGQSSHRARRAAAA